MSRLELLDLRAIEVFLVVGETLSMTQAAKKLGLTQSAVSHSVTGLERALGEKLLDRSFRPIVLTAAGHALQSAGVEILRNLEVLHSTISGIRLGRLKHFRIGLTDSLAGSFVPNLVQALSNEVESLSIRTTLSVELLRLVEVGELDFAIVFGDAEIDPSLRTSAILNENYVLVTPRRSERAALPDDIRQLAEQLPLVRWTSGAMRTEIEIQLKRMRIPIGNVYEVDTLRGVMAMVESGLGWTITTPITAYDAWKTSDNIVVKPFPRFVFQRRLIGIFRDNRFAGISQTCARSARKILAERFVTDIVKREPSLEGTMTISMDEDFG